MFCQFWHISTQTKFLTWVTWRSSLQQGYKVPWCYSVTTVSAGLLVSVCLPYKILTLCNLKKLSTAEVSGTMLFSSNRLSLSTGLSLHAYHVRFLPYVTCSFLQQSYQVPCYLVATVAAGLLVSVCLPYKILTLCNLKKLSTAELSGPMLFSSNCLSWSTGLSLLTM